MSSLSVIVNTKNSGRFLRAALESVTAIADEIVLVDMASTDETLTIAGDFPKVKVYQYPDPDIGYADPAREYAFARAHGDWLLILDSDEEMPSELATICRQIVDGQKIAALPDLPNADIYYLPRHNEIFGHFFDKTGWYPDYQLRLWKKGMIKWRPGVHSQPEILGTSAYVPYENQGYAIIHHNYQSVSQFLSRADKYTEAAAKQKLTDDPKKALGPQDLWQSFFGEFWRRAFRDEGLLEGNHGVALSLLQSAYELIVTAKIWEGQGFPSTNLTNQQLENLHKQFMHESRYWWADLMVRHSRGFKRIYWRIRRLLS